MIAREPIWRASWSNLLTLQLLNVEYVNLIKCFNDTILDDTFAVITENALVMIV